MQDKVKTMYDYMREADKKEEDASCPDEWADNKPKTDREEYFDFYDDIKTNIREDW